MLKPPKIGGAEQLRLFVDDIGFDRCCRIIDVHPATVRRWLRGAAPVPQAPLQALYWLTRWGFSDAASEVHWSHAYLASRVRAMEAALSWRAPDTVAANEPVYHHPTLTLVR